MVSICCWQDLGSGWGSLALWLCEQYPHCTVTTVSNSRTQQQWIRSEAHRKGFMNRITCVTSDANVFNTQLRFDRVVSIEMFEVRALYFCYLISSTVLQAYAVFCSDHKLPVKLVSLLGL